VFDHVTIRVSDRASSEAFYRTVLDTLGIEQTHSGDDFPEWNDFSLASASDDKPVTRGLHIGFVAPSREHVDEFWRTGTAAGYRDDGSPGARPQYSATYYGAFLLDPDGNSAEAVHHGSLRRGGVDHLWIRVADVSAARAFYETVAPHAGFRFVRQRQEPERAQFAGEGGSFSVVAGTPTENLHVAFPADDDEAVRRFHAAATAAGYRDNGAPGERPVYHRGYYGAFVLDPDGNNVEVVNHNR
jgi:catechol 2,3-dioxygenase-like lactoylglutathione lyase family enzyme